MAVSSILNRTNEALKSASAIATVSMQTVIDTVVAYASAAASIGVMAVQVLAAVGVVVALVVAPVPTAIGVTIIELLIVSSASRLSKTEDELHAKKIARENGRLIDKLAKFGTIPATAIVETDSASLRLDTVADTISGQVKTGIFSRRKIEDMSVDELRMFASEADAETARLLEAYLVFRQTPVA